MSMSSPTGRSHMNLYIPTQHDPVRAFQDGIPEIRPRAVGGSPRIKNCKADTRPTLHSASRCKALPCSLQNCLIPKRSGLPETRRSPVAARARCAGYIAGTGFSKSLAAGHRRPTRQRFNHLNQRHPHESDSPTSRPHSAKMMLPSHRPAFNVLAQITGACPSGLEPDGTVNQFWAF
jgi:hypothetical protein